MLKAVRFDEQQHREILNHIENYRDSKGKRNESEAMRNLMQLGLESLNKVETASIPAIDVEQIKADLFNQIMAALPKQPIYQPEPTFKVTQFSHIETLKEVEEEIESIPLPPKVDLSNPLLANLLGNMNK